MRKPIQYIVVVVVVLLFLMGMRYCYFQVLKKDLDQQGSTGALLMGSDTSNFSFILISDTHYGSESARVNTLRTIAAINNIHRENYPDDEQDFIDNIRGVIHCGDILEDPNDSVFELFEKDFGLVGEGLTPYPVYELFGNHDGGTQEAVRQGIIRRNKNRKDVTAISENGLHYSWNWGNIHFVALNSYPGGEWDDTCGWCHYFKDPFRYPEHSIEFLESDLKEQVGDTGNPVILLQHYGWDGFSKLWWTQAERDRYYEVIKDYKVLAIFNGHTHAVEQREWHGIPNWSVGSAQKGADPGDFLVVRVKDGKLSIFHRSGNHWKN